VKEACLRLFECYEGIKMKKIYKIIIGSLLFLGLTLASIHYIRTSNIAVLEPQGVVGVKEKDLIVTASLLMLIVVIPVFFMAIYFVWKFREHKKERHAPDWEHNTIAEVCWWGVPFVIISALAVITWKSSFELSPFKPLSSNREPITIQVVALQYKWLFIYPEQGVASLNYMRMPVDTPVKFLITSDAPMNSFWIPQLGGQIYAMPAMVSTLSLMANKVGVYRGLSANLSGKGFAAMKFSAEATSDDDFSSWINRARDSEGLDLPLYNKLIEPSQNDTAQTFRLADREIFNKAVMKYMSPSY
jgi:cytochrome o ubiquinol oxidase subunit II